MVQLGRISGVQGVRGWLKVFSDTQPREQIFDYSSWWLCREDRIEQVRHLAWKPSGKTLIVSLDGVSTREQAERLVGAGIAVPESAMPRLEGGQYYWYQLVGLSAWVRDAQGEALELGCVDHLMETGANDVLVIRPTESSIDDRQRLVPWSLEQTVREVDLAAGRIELDWDPDF